MKDGEGWCVREGGRETELVGGRERVSVLL